MVEPYLELEQYLWIRCGGLYHYLIIFFEIFVHFVVVNLSGVLSLLFLGARSWWSGWMIDFLLADR